MIKETEHFILDTREILDAFNNPCHIAPKYGLTIKIKNADNTNNDLLDVLPNTQIKFMTDPGSYLTTYGTMLQDSITSWELYTELVELIDEANYRVGLAVIMADTDCSIN